MYRLVICYIYRRPKCCVGERKTVETDKFLAVDREWRVPSGPSFFHQILVYISKVEPVAWPVRRWGSGLSVIWVCCNMSRLTADETARCGPWRSRHGPLPKAHGTWRSRHGPWRKAHDTWRRRHRPWNRRRHVADVLCDVRPGRSMWSTWHATWPRYAVRDVGSLTSGKRRKIGIRAFSPRVL